jgi:hypothetical protein
VVNDGIDVVNDGIEEVTGGGGDSNTTTDTTAPTLAEVTAVTALTNDTTPDYTFSSTEAGTITYGGSCTSSATSASSGNNAITFSTLSNGTYDNCTVMVTDNASNSSSNLPVSTFTVDNTTISSSATDNATVVFGQTYQYQLTTSSTFSGTITYSLSNQPDNMTISSSGSVEWTPTKASQITTHSNITITLTTASGYVLEQTYDLVVTGTCTSGAVLGIWSGDQRNSIDSTKYLGNISAYTDNASTRKTASENYNLSGNSANITFGPTAEVNKGSVFFYHQYDNTTHLYFNFFFGVEGGSDSESQFANVDIFTSKNTSEDYVIVMDDKASEFSQYDNSSANSLYSASYKGRFKWKGNTDGGLIGPFTGSDFKVYMILSGTSTINSDTLSLCVSEGSCLTSMNYFSKDNKTVSLGDKDDFTVGYKATIDCSN